MSIYTSAAMYAGTLALIFGATVSPMGKGLTHEWKMLILFGLLPSMIKMASMAGEAQLGTQVLLIAAGVTIGAHLLLRMASDKYKNAIEKPHESDIGTAVMSWGGITLVYALAMIGMLVFKGGKRFNSSATVKNAAPAPA